MAKNSPLAAKASTYLSLQEAVRELHVKPATLYTYVSRGWIRRLGVPQTRKSLYFREDIERLRARSDARASEGVLAAAAIRYGEPVILTSVTELTLKGPRYRDREAIELALGGATFEAVAELLWTGELSATASWRSRRTTSQLWSSDGLLASIDQTINIHDAFAIVGMAVGLTRRDAVGRARPERESVKARELIRALTGCFGLLSVRGLYREPRSGESIAESLSAGLGLDITADNLRALNAALALCADHELNPATFIARIAASAGSDLHSCILAAIYASAGPRIASGCDRLEQFVRSPREFRAFMRDPSNTVDAAEIAAAGFNHPLYPTGDPRGRCLLEIIDQLYGHMRYIGQCIEQVKQASGEYKLYPRLELALAILSVALNLPQGAAGGLYTLSRVAGWVAHISEQRSAGFLIRPRARFAGGSRHSGF